MCPRFRDPGIQILWDSESGLSEELATSGLQIAFGMTENLQDKSDLNEQALRESNHEGDAMASVSPAQPMHKAQVLRPPVETEEVFFIRKCVGHRMRSVLFEGPGEQV